MQWITFVFLAHIYLIGETLADVECVFNPGNGFGGKFKYRGRVSSVQIDEVEFRFQ